MTPEIIDIPTKRDAHRSIDTPTKPVAPVVLNDAVLQTAIRQYEAGRDITAIAKTLGQRSVTLQKKMKALLGADEWKDSTTMNVDACMDLIVSELKMCVDKEDATYASSLKTLLEFQKWRAEKLAAHVYAPPKLGNVGATFTINMQGLTGATLRMSETVDGELVSG